MDHVNGLYLSKGVVHTEVNLHFLVDNNDTDSVLKDILLLVEKHNPFKQKEIENATQSI